MIDESENDKKLKITLIRLSTQSLDDRRNKKKVENIAENKLKNIDKTVKMYLSQWLNCVILIENYSFTKPTLPNRLKTS